VIAESSHENRVLPYDALLVCAFIARRVIGASALFAANDAFVRLTYRGARAGQPDRALVITQPASGF
jgi:hypothetical protein